MSLLGVVACMLLTRKDNCVSCRICSVGRKTPKFIHIERLSALVKWVQAHPQTLMYRAFQREGRTAAPSPHQRAYADSAFKKEDIAGHAMRGSSHRLCLGVDDPAFVRTRVCRVLGYVSRQQRRAARATAR